MASRKKKYIDQRKSSTNASTLSLLLHLLVNHPQQRHTAMAVITVEVPGRRPDMSAAKMLYEIYPPAGSDESDASANATEHPHQDREPILPPIVRTMLNNPDAVPISSFENRTEAERRHR